MTKTTEELKRDMYDLALEMRNDPYHDCFKSLYYRLSEKNYGKFESALEAYLEALRQESIAKDVRIDHLERMGDVMRDGYMYQQQLTAQARNEADSERNRRQAFEFANKSAGEFLQEARAKVKAQRQSIGQLKNERDNAQHALKVKTTKLEKAPQELQELRKVVPGTSAQSSEEGVACVKCGGTGQVLMGDNVPGAFLQLINCPFCEVKS